jgi:hypothetical protein
MKKDGRSRTTLFLIQAQKGDQRDRSRNEDLPKVEKMGVMEMAFLDHEQMRILVLDTKNRVVENISRYQYRQ